jgi:hypothetical protein
MRPFQLALMTGLNGPAPNQKSIPDTRAGMSEMWAGNPSAGFQKSCACWVHHLQRGTLRQRQRYLRETHDHIGETEILTEKIHRLFQVQAADHGHMLRLLLLLKGV